MDKYDKFSLLLVFILLGYLSANGGGLYPWLGACVYAIWFGFMIRTKHP